MRESGQIESDLLLLYINIGPEEDSMQEFVFIIGYNKTATTALHELFCRSGLSSIHWDGGKLALTMVSNICSGRRVFDGYDARYRVFSDLIYLDARVLIEGNEYFEEMMNDYPNARFIYNYRNQGEWIRSRLLHANDSGIGFLLT